MNFATKSVLFFLLLSVTLTASAEQVETLSFRSLADMYLKGTSFEQRNLERESAQTQLDQVNAQNGFLLSASSQYQISRPAGLFSFQVQPTKTLVSSIGLSKSFKWGGDVSLTESWVRTDISEWDEANRRTLTSDVYNNIAHTLTYEQDFGRNFFGVNERKQIRAAETSLGLEIKRLSFNKQSDFLNLFELYLRIRRDKKLLALAREDFDRLKKRESYVRKRWVEGIALKADYLASQQSVLSAEREIFSREDLLEQAFVQLGSLLNRSVDTSLIRPLDEILNAQISEWKDVENFILSDSPEVIEALQAYEIAKLDKESKSWDTMPDIKLGLGYEVEDLDSDFSTTFENSISERERYEKRIYLNVSIPLGKRVVKAENERARINERRAQINADQTRKRIELQFNRLRLNLKSLVRRSKGNQKKYRLARDLVIEQTKRFNRGQIEYDQYLTARDQQAQSERELYGDVYQAFWNKAQLEYLAGRGEQFFSEIRL